MGIDKNAKVIYVSEGTEVIKHDDFANCENLEEIYLPNTVRCIDKMGFLGLRSLKIVHLPESLEVIEDDAFNGCDSLVSVDIPKNVRKIGKTFCFCPNLRSINVSMENPFYFSRDGVLFARESNGTSVLMKYPEGKEEREYTVPYDVIGVTLGFFGCRNLTAVNITRNCGLIGSMSFSCMPNLEAINVEQGNMSYSSDNGVLYSSDRTIIYCYPSGKNDKFYNIPEGVKTIYVTKAYTAFRDCPKLISVHIPDSLFCFCRSRGNEFYRPDYIYMLNGENNTFFVLNNETRSTGSDDGYMNTDAIRKDGSYNFYNRFDHVPFAGCDNLESVTVGQNNPFFASSDGVLYTKNGDSLLCCPNGRRKLVLLETVTKFEYRSVTECKKLETITFPDHDLSFPAYDNKLKTCKNLKTVIVSNKNRNTEAPACVKKLIMARPNLELRFLNDGSAASVSNTQFGSPQQSMSNQQFGSPQRSMSSQQFGSPQQSMPNQQFGSPQRSMPNPQFGSPQQSMSNQQFGSPQRSMSNPQFGNPQQTSNQQDSRPVFNAVKTFAFGKKEKKKIFWLSLVAYVIVAVAVCLLPNIIPFNRGGYGVLLFFIFLVTALVNFTDILKNGYGHGGFGYLSWVLSMLISLLSMFILIDHLPRKEVSVIFLDWLRFSLLILSLLTIIVRVISKKIAQPFREQNFDMSPLEGEKLSDRYTDDIGRRVESLHFVSGRSLNEIKSIVTAFSHKTRADWGKPEFDNTDEGSFDIAIVMDRELGLLSVRYFTAKFKVWNVHVYVVERGSYREVFLQAYGGKGAHLPASVDKMDALADLLK